MVFQAITSQSRYQNINGQIQDLKYNLAINPLGKNNVYVQTSSNGNNMAIKYDNLDDFFTHLSKSKNSIFDLIKNDTQYLKTNKLPSRKKTPSKHATIKNKKHKKYKKTAKNR